MSDPSPQTDAMPDDALLIAYANGDARAAAELTQRLAPRVLAQAARLLGDRAEAEDVTQEAMVRLWRIAPDWRQGEAQVSTWLYRVTANLCIDRQRKSGRTAPLDEAGDPADERPNTEASLIDAERAQALQDALATLPDRQREAVVLRHIEGYSNPEIAAVMDIGVEAVESLTARGKRALKAALAGRNEELGYDDAG